MNRTTLAWVWASAILAVAIAAGFDLIGTGMAEGLYLGLLLGAGVSIGRARRCASC